MKYSLIATCLAVLLHRHAVAESVSKPLQDFQGMTYSLCCSKGTSRLVHQKFQSTSIPKKTLPSAAILLATSTYDMHGSLAKMQLIRRQALKLAHSI